MGSRSDKGKGQFGVVRPIENHRLWCNVCKNGWTDRDVVWGGRGWLTDVGPRNHVLDGCQGRPNPFAAMRDDKMAMWHFIKIPWPLVSVGVVEFLKNGQLSVNHRDFKDISYEGSLLKLSVSADKDVYRHAFNLAQAYTADIMPYTNYT